MSARIAKGGQRPRQTSRGAPRGGGRKPKKQTLLQQAGIAPGTVRRAAGWLFLGIAIAGTAAAVAAYRVPQLIGTAMGETVGDAGFVVKGYEIRGINRMERRRIDAVVEAHLGRPMPLVDLAGLRNELVQFGWVGDARVSRRFPDKLVIDIVERQPAAIWQHEQRLFLIDANGVVLDRVALEAMPDLPLVIGPHANQHTTALSSLLASAPHLRPQITGATWVGGRRWDLRFQTGELLSLPEHDDAAMRAFAEFARRDRAVPLLGRGFARFDMRIPGQLIVRVSREPGSAVPAIAPETPPATAPGTPAADLSNTI